MKKLVFWICFLWPAFLRAESKVPLIDIYLDEPAIQEQFRIWDFGDHEELVTTSNAQVFPAQEFGTYIRGPSDLSARIERLKESVKASGFITPSRPTIEWPNWHVFLKGEEIDPLDPRFDAAFDLLEQAKSDLWRRKDVTLATFRWRPFELSVSRLQYADRRSKLTRPHIARQVLFPFDACQHTWVKRLVCSVQGGFILLSSSGEGRADPPRH